MIAKVQLRLHMPGADRLYILEVEYHLHFYIIFNFSLKYILLLQIVQHEEWKGNFETCELNQIKKLCKIDTLNRIAAMTF